LALLRWVVERLPTRPYSHIDGYLERDFIVRPSKWTLGIGVRIHRFVSSDTDRALHDHPWWWITLVLRGGYMEEVPKHGQWGAMSPQWDRVTRRELVREILRPPGCVMFRPRWHRHRIQLLDEQLGATTLFITGPKRYRWGFLTMGGWVDHVNYGDDM
jgi:hypothetical protein